MVRDMLRKIIFAAVFACLLLTATTIAFDGCAPSQVYVRTAPPRTRHEALPPRPHPNAVWLSGYWAWTGNEYEWVAGHWEAKPKGDAWVPGRWKKTHQGWIYVRGHWSK